MENAQPHVNEDANERAENAVQDQAYIVYNMRTKKVLKTGEVRYYPTTKKYIPRREHKTVTREQYDAIMAAHNGGMRPKLICVQFGLTYYEYTRVVTGSIKIEENNAPERQQVAQQQ